MEEANKEIKISKHRITIQMAILRAMLSAVLMAIRLAIIMSSLMVLFMAAAHDHYHGNVQRH